jgi:protein-L-isoaspartate(D-aspartate) O-methyltransferase
MRSRTLQDNLPDGGIRRAHPADAAPTDDDEALYARQRAHMVATQIENRGLADRRVLAAMRRVRRHLFMPAACRPLAYEDHPLPIGAGQTISQPYIVAYMTAALHPEAHDRVIEIGTGSGYQAAILSALVREVYSLEIRPALAERARATLQAEGCHNVRIRVGDGAAGWPEAAPFDAAIFTCAPVSIPAPLIAQLREGGRLVIPVGPAQGLQQLLLGVRRGDRIETQAVMGVAFVPMVH